MSNPALIKKFENTYKVKSTSAKSASKANLNAITKINDLKKLIEESGEIISSIEGMQATIDSDLELINNQFEDTINKSCAKIVANATRIINKAKQSLEKGNTQIFAKDFASAKDQMTKNIHAEIQVAPISRREFVIKIDPKTEAAFADYDALLAKEEELIKSGGIISTASKPATTSVQKPAAKPQAQAQAQTKPATPRMPTGKFTPEQSAFIAEYRKKSMTAKAASKGKINEAQDAIDNIELFVIDNEEVANSINGMKEFIEYERNLFKEQYEELIIKTCTSKAQNSSRYIKGAKDALNAGNSTKFKLQIEEAEKILKEQIADAVAITPLERKDDIIAKTPTLATVFDDFISLEEDKDNLVLKADNLASVTKLASDLKKIMNSAKFSIKSNPTKSNELLDEVENIINGNKEALSSAGIDFSEEISTRRKECYDSYMNDLYYKADRAVSGLLLSFKNSINNHDPTECQRCWNSIVSLVNTKCDPKYFPYSLLDKKEQIIEANSEYQIIFDTYDMYKDKIDTIIESSRCYRVIIDNKCKIKDNVKYLKGVPEDEYMSIFRVIKIISKEYKAVTEAYQNSLKDTEITEVFDEIKKLIQKKNLVEAMEDPEAWIINISEKEYHKFLTKLLSLLPFPKAVTPFCLLTETVRFAQIYANSFKNQDLNGVEQARLKFNEVNKLLMDNKLSVNDADKLNTVMSCWNLLKDFKEDSNTNYEYEKGTLSKRLSNEYSEFKKATGIKIPAVDNMLLENEKLLDKGYENIFKQKATEFVKGFKDGKVKTKTGIAYCQMLKIFHIDESLNLPNCDFAYLSIVCQNLLDDKYQPLIQKIKTWDGSQLHWLNELSDYDFYKPLYSLTMLIELLITQSHNITFNSLPESVKKLIQFLNMLISLECSSVIVLIHKINSLLTDQHTINYNNCLIKGLQTVIKSHASSLDSIKSSNKKICKLLNEALKPVQVESKNLILYEYEKTIFLSSLKKQINELKNPKVPTDLLNLLSYTDFLRSIYCYDIESVSLIEEVDQKVMNVFGFIPHIAYFAERITPMIQKTISGDIELSKNLFLSSSYNAWKDENDFYGLSSNLYCVRTFMMNSTVAKILHLLHKRWSDSEHFSWIFTESFPNSVPNNTLDSDHFYENGFNEDDFELIQNRFECAESNPKSLGDCNMSIRKIYQNYTTCPLHYMGRIAYLLTLAPKHLPCNVNASLIVPNTEWYYHYQHDNDNIPYYEFQNNVNNLLKELERIYVDDKESPIYQKMILNFIEQVNSDKSIIFPEVERLIKDFNKEMYNKYIEPFSDSKMTNEKQEVFVITKTNEGLSITVNNTNNTFLDLNTFVYLPTVPGDKMILRYSNGEAYEKDGEIIWKYKGRVAQTHKKEAITKFKIEGNVPDIIQVFMSHAFKMPPLIEEIENKIENEIIQNRLDVIASNQRRILDSIRRW